MKWTPRRLALSALIGLAIVAAVLSAVRVWRSDTPHVRITRARVGPLESWITTNGTIEPREPHVLRASFATFVTAIDVIEGQRVRRGDRLLTLEVAQKRVDLAHAREDLVRLRNALRDVESGSRTAERAQVARDLRTSEIEADQLRRARDATVRLVEKQAATRDELERVELALARAEAARDTLARKQRDLDRTTPSDVEAARLAAERAQQAANLLDTQVRSADLVAPLDGTVYALPVRAGSRVETGAVLAQVANLRAVQLRAFVDEPELASIMDGQRVEVTWSSVPNHIWTGVVERVPKNVVSRGDRMVGEVVCSVDNDDERLIPNLDVDVRIRLRFSSRALIIPRQAVRSDRGGRYVFVVRDNVVERRAVVVDAANATTDSVVHGLKEGDLVVADGAELRDGVRVHVEAEAP